MTALTKHIGASFTVAYRRATDCVVQCDSLVIIIALLLSHTRRYDAGDHLAVYPTNDPELVEKLGQRLEADLGQIFTLTNVDGDY